MILLFMSVFGGLLNLKRQNNPACFKSVRVFKTLQLDIYLPLRKKKKMQLYLHNYSYILVVTFMYDCC